MPQVKTRHQHNQALVASKVNEVQVFLEAELKRRGITLDDMDDEERVNKTQVILQGERAALDAARPYNAAMRTVLLKQLDEIAATKFRMKPLRPPLQVTSPTNLGTGTRLMTQVS
jgi:hypothetical protein